MSDEERRSSSSSPKKRARTGDYPPPPAGTEAAAATAAAAAAAAAVTSPAAAAAIIPAAAAAACADRAAPFSTSFPHGPSDSSRGGSSGLARPGSAADHGSASGATRHQDPGRTHDEDDDDDASIPRHRYPRRDDEEYDEEGEQRRQREEGRGDPDNVGRSAPFEPERLVREVVASALYYGDQGVANYFAPKRNETLKDMTMEDLRLVYQSNRAEFEEILGKIGVPYGPCGRRVAGLFPPPQSLEDMLREAAAGTPVVALNAEKEVELYKRRAAVPLPSLDDLYRVVVGVDRRTDGEGPPLSRDIPLSLVLGASGAGKTFFCLQYLTDLFRPKELPTIVAYLKPAHTGVSFPRRRHRGAGGGTVAGGNGGGSSALVAHDHLISWVMQCLEARIKQEIRRKLAMHLCLIVDEAGDEELKGYFEDKASLSALCTAAQAKFQSVHVAVAGTNLSGQSLSSSSDVYMFRMPPWQPADLVGVLQSRAGVFELEGAETVHDIARAISDEPVLEALSTNARSVAFLLDAIARLSSSPRTTWNKMLRAWTPALVDRVVQDYLTSNRIRNLRKDSRRRIAAWVFYALDRAKLKDSALPEFPGLDAHDRSIAMSLLHSNVEFSGDSTRLVENANYAITVTPAIAIILFTMLGVPSTVMVGWQAQEELALLYAFRRLACAKVELRVADITKEQRYLGGEAGSSNLDAFEAELWQLAEKKLIEWRKQPALRVEALHDLADKDCRAIWDRVNDGTTKLSRNDIQTVVDGLFKDYKVRVDEGEQRLSKELRKLRVVRLPGKLEDVTTQIPLVTSDTVLLNGDKARFADVIGPFALIQAKNTVKKDKAFPVNIRDELKKCGLLKERTDPSVLRALVWMWGGGLDGSGVTAEPKHDAAASGNARVLQASKTFPENLLKRCVQREVIEHGTLTGSTLTYSSFTGEQGLRTQQTVQLPDVQGGAKIRFILFTNANAIQLQGIGTVTEASLNESLQIAENEAGAKLWGKWSKFFEDEVRTGVTIRFVFTRSA